jgi:hypothetical protein
MIHPNQHQQRLIWHNSKWGNKRSVRRLSVLLWIGLLLYEPWQLAHVAHSVAPLGILPELLIPVLTQLAILWFAFRSMRIGLAQPTLEDSAVMHYDTQFDNLTTRQFDELNRDRFRNFLLGRVHPDEREAELRLQAEGAAYRVLRPTLLAAIAIYWAVCLLGPFAEIRETLVITAIAFTWLAVTVLVLPTMIRMWTQPNEVGDLRDVNARGDSL